MRLFAAAALLAGAYAGAPPSSFATPPRPPPRSSGLFNFSSALGDHMVLRMAPARALVWGSDAPGTNVTVAIDGGAGGSFSGQTDATGTWRVVLGAVGAGGPHSLSATSSGGGDALALQDVYFGAVFVCGGQSNMQFSVGGALNATAEIADAINHPLIRVFTVGQGGSFSDGAPLPDFASIEQGWSVASPASVGQGDFGYFSALCYFFARGLQEALGEPAVPIGAVSSNWGGTCLSSWAPADGSAAADCGVSGTSGHSNLYNGLVAPLTRGPMAVDGFLFSQGECDADCNNTAYYRCAFPRFIQDWRREFDVLDAFFSFQVLPAYVNDSGRFNPYSLPYERSAQLQGLTAGGRVHAANTIDLGDALAPHGSVHPRNKQAVAARMVAAARALVFNDASVAYLSPSYSAATPAPPAGADLVVTVSFAPAPPASGRLMLQPAACPTGIGGLPASECSWFEVQTTDGAWHNATGVALSADAKRLVLTVPGAGALTAAATRGFWSPWPVVVLFSAEGLPALPWWEPVGMVCEPGGYVAC